MLSNFMLLTYLKARIIFLVPFGYGIIWYERYGSDKKRILVNRLLTSLCWTGIELYTVIIPLDIVRYVTGPMSVHLESIL
jgi:hypothetical protein